MNEALHFNKDGSLRASPSPSLDHFAFFDLAPTPKLDAGQLEADYFALSRRFHPDFFVARPIEQQLISLEKTAALNNAYRVLRDPTSRLEYLVELVTGHPFGEGGEPRQVTMELLSDVLEIRERLADLAATPQTSEEAAGRAVQLAAIAADRQWAGQLQAACDGALNELGEAWDRLLHETANGRESANEERRTKLIAEMTDQLARRRYFSGLLKEIEKATH